MEMDRIVKNCLLLLAIAMLGTIAKAAVVNPRMVIINSDKQLVAAKNLDFIELQVKPAPGIPDFDIDATVHVRHSTLLDGWYQGSASYVAGSLVPFMWDTSTAPHGRYNTWATVQGMTGQVLGPQLSVVGVTSVGTVNILDPTASVTSTTDAPGASETAYVDSDTTVYATFDPVVSVPGFPIWEINGVPDPTFTGDYNITIAPPDGEETIRVTARCGYNWAKSMLLARQVAEVGVKQNYVANVGDTVTVNGLVRMKRGNGYASGITGRLEIVMTDSDGTPVSANISITPSAQVTTNNEHTAFDDWSATITMPTAQAGVYTIKASWVAEGSAAQDVSHTITLFSDLTVTAMDPQNHNGTRIATDGKTLHLVDHNDATIKALGIHLEADEPQWSSQGGVVPADGTREFTSDHAADTTHTATVTAGNSSNSQTVTISRHPKLKQVISTPGINLNPWKEALRDGVSVGGNKLSVVIGELSFEASVENAEVKNSPNYGPKYDIAAAIRGFGLTGRAVHPTLSGHINTPDFVGLEVGWEVFVEARGTITLSAGFEKPPDESWTAKDVEVSGSIILEAGVWAYTEVGSLSANAQLSAQTGVTGALRVSGGRIDGKAGWLGLQGRLVVELLRNNPGGAGSTRILGTESLVTLIDGANTGWVVLKDLSTIGTP